MPMKSRNILEAKRFMTDRERKLRAALVKLLRDDGKGHRHAKYAERLAKFDVNIVPLSADSNFTAAISFDTGVIYISEGFLLDPSLFYQLNVLMRHELAHNLLMHQIRMMNYLGEDAWKIFGSSASLHKILNIIMDDEISNKKYSAEDKEVVRNMYLNGRVIGGLVTEDHRADWLDLPVEQLYDRIKKELDELHEQLINGFQLKIKNDSTGQPDFITSNLASTFMYNDTESSSIIKGSLDKFIKNGCSLKTQNGAVQLSSEYRSVAEAIYNSLTVEPISAQQIEDLITLIARSHPAVKTDLIHPETGEIMVTLYSPESKLVAQNVLKKYRSAYDDWYKKVLKVLTSSGYNSNQIHTILQKIKEKPDGAV